MKHKHKVVTRSPHRSVGLIACTWLQKSQVEYESQLERRFIQKVLITPNVIEIISQPFQIFYGEQNELSYTPDFLVKFENGNQFVIEVKPYQFIDKHRPLFNSVDKILIEKNLIYCIVTELEIDNETSDQDIGLILRYTKGSVNNESILAVQNLFNPNNQKVFSIEEISQLANVPKSTVLHMIGRRLLKFKEDISTSSGTKIISNLKDTLNDDLCVSSWLDTTAWRTNPRIHPDDQLKRGSVRRSDHTPRIHMGNFKSHS
jgi:hypothetical protein